MICSTGMRLVPVSHSVVMPALEAELGISKVQLGIFLTLNGIIYGISRFVNGFLADRFSRRKLMTLGLVLSAVTNLIICFSPSMSIINTVRLAGAALVPSSRARSLSMNSARLASPVS